MFEHMKCDIETKIFPTIVLVFGFAFSIYCLVNGYLSKKKMY